jgi:alanyl aminopeptidase
MFERFVGPEVFLRGLREYLSQHAFGNATTEDLLRALSHAADRDVTQPFMTFLTQPGVPLLETQLVCQEGQPAQLKLHQSRYLPLGSAGDPRQTWQIPVCARYAAAGIVRESCSLLTEADGVLPLEGGCPSWILPNADGVGYYYFALPGADLDKLRDQGLAQLSARERYVLLQSLMAGVAADAVSANVLLALLPRFAADDERLIATIPLSYLRGLRDHWLARPELAPAARLVLEAKFAKFVRSMYAASAQRLGLTAQKRESGDTRIMRAQVLSGMCDLVNDSALRSVMARLGRQYLGLDSDGELHPQVVASELQDLAVRMLVEDGDAATFEAVYQRLVRADDASERARYLTALASVRDVRADKALALSLDPALRVNEVLIPLRQQLGDYRTRARAHEYLEQHFGQLGQRVAPSALANTPWLLVGECDQAQAARIHAFFAPRIESLPGGPRSVGGALEAIGLCDAMFKAQSPALDAFFAKL